MSILIFYQVSTFEYRKAAFIGVFVSRDGQFNSLHLRTIGSAVDLDGRAMFYGDNIRWCDRDAALEVADKETIGLLCRVK
ncbi:hypothetical protein K0M31_005395 [Melipona bicolor]|uniref:Uncharacterized protein n=1 Tax=Melipona bicolor TaxID=60889 RepID=A0AA40FVJ9_9HYME|nr:hypothetical protein K0M31_005395 [Melipona bicolor]